MQELTIPNFDLVTANCTQQLSMNPRVVVYPSHDIWLYIPLNMNTLAAQDNGKIERRTSSRENIQISDQNDPYENSLQ